MPTKPNFLRRTRTQNGLTQEQLASLLGVSFTTVNAWENGKRRMPAGIQETLETLLSSQPSGDELQRKAMSGLARSNAGFLSSVISYNGRKDCMPYTHGIGRWYGSLPSFLVADIVELCVSELGPAKRALVNFCGSGTAALEFALAGVDCSAIDVNPAAWLFTTVKTQRLKAPSERAICAFISDVRGCRVNRRIQGSDGNLIHSENKWVTPAAQAMLLKAVNAINARTSRSERLIFAASLLNIAVDICQIDKRCTNHYVYKENSVESEGFFKLLENQCHVVSEKIKALSGAKKYKTPNVSLQDNRHTNFADRTFDVVFAHPPYGTMINYYSMSRVHLSILELVDLGLGDRSKPSLLDTTRRADQSSSTNKAFSNAIAGWVGEAARVLRVNGHLVCIIGDGREQGYLNHPHTQVIAQAEEAGMRLKELFIWVTENKSGMHVKRKGHHIDHNYILVFQKA